MRPTLLFLLLSIPAACADGDGSGFFITSVPQPATDRPIEGSFRNYVTSDTCRACHPRTYDTWYASYHRTMTQEVSPASVLAPWEGELELRDERYVLERRGQEFWVELPDPEHPKGSPDPAPRVWREVVLSTGSHHFQAYWFASGSTRKLSLFLMCYRIDEQRWMPVDSAFVNPPEVHRKTGKGRWNRECMDCHTTRPQPGIESQVHMDSFAAELNIACEACHGPAAEHIEANRSPLARYQNRNEQGVDSTIFDPADMPAQMSVQVCGQCHGMLAPANDRLAEKARKKGLPYRFDEGLFAKRSLVTEGEFYFWEDGEVRVSGREFNAVINSPCFQHEQEDKRMDCLSCHVMHQTEEDSRPIEEWLDDQLKPNMRGDLACLQCHDEYRDTSRIAEHTHHPVESIGSSCMNCHMPYTCWALLKTSRSHQIASPSVKPSVETGRPNACNLCHLDQSIAWAGDKLGEWYGQEAVELKKEHHDLASGVLWSLTGDAGQRALMASHMGWAPAQEASGTDWMVPYLAQLLEDPYDAVRFAAGQSLQTLSGHEDFEYDFVAPEADRARSHGRALERWTPTAQNDDPARASRLLLHNDGALRRNLFAKLLAYRNNRPVVLAE